MQERFETTCDAFLDGRLHIRQPKKGFRSGLDTVFLAAACPAQEGDSVLEAGCGAGAGLLCLMSRVPGLTAWGVEADSGLAALAEENASANGFTESFRIINADVTSPWSALEEAGLHQEAYNHVIANPPFFINGRARPSSDPRNARSRAMDHGDLDAWLRFLAGTAKPGGTATVIHTAEALPELLSVFGRRFGGVSVFPLFPKADAPAIRIIVTGTKGSRAPLTLAPGLVLHEKDGTPTAAAGEILRDGKSLLDTVAEFSRQRKPC
ncbi:MAG: methyltransferase [Rhodomicrobium sp.]